ncbi:MAG: ABC-2 family transporter protein [Chloroflexota bacterium]
MTFYLQLFLKLLKVNIKAQMEYRTDFLVSVIHILLLQLGNLALIWVILAKFQTINGWGFGEIAFLLGLRLLSHGLFVVFNVEILWGLKSYIIDGEFDRFLLKPVNPLMLLIGNKVELRGLTDFVSGIVILAIATSLLDLQWTFTKLAVLVAVILGSILIEMAVYLAASSASFWILNLEALNSIVFQFHEQYILYPVSIYGRPIQYVLTFVIPFAFINFYPSLYFLNKTSGGLFHPVFAYLTPLVGILSFTLSYVFVWNKGLLAYQSAGS